MLLSTYNLHWLLRVIVLGLRPIFFILASLHWLDNVTPYPLLLHRERFRRPSFPSQIDCGVGSARHAN